MVAIRSSGELGSLKRRGETAPAVPQTKKDRVSEYQQLNKIKRGLPKALVSELEKRKVTSVEEAAKVAQALRTKRVKSHKGDSSENSKPTPKRKGITKKEDLRRLGRKATRKAVSAMKQALNSGIVRL